MSERLNKINSLIKKIVSEIIQHDLDFTKAASFFYTVTEVRVTPDLQEADIYVSILGDKQKEEDGFKHLCRNLGKIQKIFSSRIRLKFTPKLKLKFDSTTDYAFRINELINQIHQNDSKST